MVERHEHDGYMALIADLQRRLISHQKGEAIDAKCHVCKKAYCHVDDEPIRCPFCGVDGRPG